MVNTPALSATSPEQTTTQKHPSAQSGLRRAQQRKEGENYVPSDRMRERRTNIDIANQAIVVADT